MARRMPSAVWCVGPPANRTTGCSSELSASGLSASGTGDWLGVRSVRLWTDRDRCSAPPPTRSVDQSAGSRSPPFARNFEKRHRLAHLGRCVRCWLLRSRRCCRTHLFALRSTTAEQDTAACRRIRRSAWPGGCQVRCRLCGTANKTNGHRLRATSLRIAGYQLSATG